MNILFLTLLDFSSIKDEGIYTDLLRVFEENNHNISIVSPVEKKSRRETEMIEEGNVRILKLKIGNLQKTGFIEKGISMLLLENKFKKGIKEYFSNIKFDLIIYSTPPITLQKAVEYVKKRDGSKTYLLLKDIFPQNALDLGILKKQGVSGLIYKYFLIKESKLYKISDYIGCMSKANVEFLLQHNTGIDPSIVEVCPNSINPNFLDKSDTNMNEIRKKYGIPCDKVVFIYGGNLGKPQGIDFLIKCLESNKNSKNAYFLIVGSGTELSKLKYFIDDEKPCSCKLIEHIPKAGYEELVNVCDVGLIFLDYKFTIPNFPSRLLSYMQASLPILVASDVNTDVGKIAEENNFGYWCESKNVDEFNELVMRLIDYDTRKKLGNNSRKFLEDNYTVNHSYQIIMKHFK